MVLWAVVAFLAAGAVAASEFSVVVEDASPESSEEVSAAEVPSPRRRFTIHRRPPCRCLRGCCLRLAHAFMCCTSSWAGAAPQVIALRRDLAAALAEISSLKKQLELARRKAAQAS